MARTRDSYAVIDFETTGLSPDKGSRAIEIAVVLVDEWTVSGTYQSLINPAQPIPPFITSLTGISNEMVRGAPKAAQIRSDILRLTQGRHIVAHNASFDRKFWMNEFADVDRVKEAFICTMLISRRLYPWAPNHKLSTLSSCHEIKVKGDFHRALADASATAELLLRIQEDLKSLTKEPVTAERLLRYQKTAIARAPSTRPRATNYTRIPQTFSADPPRQPRPKNTAPDPVAGKISNNQPQQSSRSSPYSDSSQPQKDEGSLWIILTVAVILIFLFW